MKILVYLNRIPKLFLLILAFILIVFLGVLGYISGAEIAFTIFYLIPISMVVWFIGKWQGILVSIASAAIWLVTYLIFTPSSKIPYWNVSMGFGFFLVFTLTLSKLKNTLQGEKDIARTDFLTDVSNGRHFLELANIEIDRALRYKHPLTIAYMDIDNLKQVNDDFGHSTGNALLHLVAQTIKKNIRSIDTVARLGGDEFAILLPEIENEQVKIVIDRIQKSLLGAMKKNKWPITFSIGVAVCKKPPHKVDDLIKLADNLMYSVKNSGKNMIKQEIF